jgi:hypothetical protein
LPLGRRVRVENGASGVRILTLERILDVTSEWTFAVTFESDTQQPETIRGQVAGSLSAATARAVRLAKQRKPTRNHYESVVVLLEKRRGVKRTGDTIECAVDAA